MDTLFDDILQDTTMEEIEHNNNIIGFFDEDHLSVESNILGDDSGLSSQISFGNHIDDIYDTSIKTAHDNLIHHLEEAVDAKTADDLKFHLDHAKEARNSEDFWQDAKHDAELESRKNEIFIEGINKQWEIMDKYQKEMKDIFKR